MSKELKLDKDDYRSPSPFGFTIEQAIEYLIDDNSGYHDGAVEVASRKASKAGEYLAKLVAKLHAKGLLTAEEVIELLDERFKVRPE